MKTNNGQSNRDIEGLLRALHRNFQDLVADFEDWFRQATNLIAGDHRELRVWFRTKAKVGDSEPALFER